MVKDNLILVLFPTILIPILTEWVDDNELGFFDSAFCNMDLRPFLLDLLAKCTISGNGHEVMPSYFKWVARREMKIRSLRLKQYHRKRLDASIHKILSMSSALKILEMKYCTNFLTVLKYCNVSILRLIGSDELTDTAFQALLPSLSSLRELDLVDCTLLTDVSFCMLAKQCPDLEYLSRRGCGECSSVSWSSVAQNGNLQTINSDDIDAAAFKAVVTASPLLTKVGLAYCTEIGDKEIQLLAEYCPKLQHINCMQVKVSELVLIQLVQQCSQLCYIDWFDTNITDKALHEVGKSTPLLKYLNIGDCQEVTDSGVMSVARGCRRLNIFIACNMDNVTDLGISTLVDHCPLLEELHISDLRGVTDASLMRVWDRCPRLRVLDCMGTSVTDVILVACCTAGGDGRGLDYINIVPGEDQATFTTMSEIVSVPGRGIDYSQPGCEMLSAGKLKLILHHSPRLRQLCLEECGAMTDDLVETLSKCCPLLECVALRRCTQVTVISLQHLAAHARNVISVSVNSMIDVTDDLLLQLVSGRPYFAGLGLDGCSGFTDDGIMKVVDACPHLRKLSLYACNALTNRSILHTLRHSPLLNDLCVSMCPSITEDVLFEILQLEKPMKYLDIKGCSGISELNVQEFLQMLGGIEIENFTYICN